MQKLLALCLSIALLSAAALPAQARDTQYLLSIEDGMHAKDAQAKLDGSVKFFFAGQTTPVIIKTLSTEVSNRKTNSFGKSDETACNWAFLSALLTFQSKAKELGANAVVNIVSDYKKKEMASASQFECHAGAIVAGVALKGDFVTIGDK